MRFKYNGDKKDLGPVYGHDFRNRKVVTIDDPFIIGKLSGNSHFDEVKPRAQKAKKVKPWQKQSKK